MFKNTSFPVIFSNSRNVTIKTVKPQLSAHKELQNAYFEGFCATRKLVTVWGEGEVFVGKSIEDEIGVDAFVGAVLTCKITKRVNCAIKATLKDIKNNKRKEAARRIASHARLNRERQESAIVGAIKQISMEYNHEDEIEKSALELKIDEGAPFGAIPAKKGIQIVLTGADFCQNPRRNSKIKVNTSLKTTKSYFQPSLFGGGK